MKSLKQDHRHLLSRKIFNPPEREVEMGSESHFLDSPMFSPDLGHPSLDNSQNFSEGNDGGMDIFALESLFGENPFEIVGDCNETPGGDTSMLLFFPEDLAPSFHASLEPCSPTRVPPDVEQKVYQLNSSGNQNFYCPNFNLSIIKRLNLKVTVFRQVLDPAVGPATLGSSLGPGRWFWQVLSSSSTQITMIPDVGVKEIQVGNRDISMDTKRSSWQVTASAQPLIAEIPVERVREIAMKQNYRCAGFVIAAIPIEIELSNTQICEGLDNASIESFNVMSMVQDTSIVHLVQTRVPCRHGSHQDCMSPTKLGLYVDSYDKEKDPMFALHSAVQFRGEGQCRIKYPFVPYDIFELGRYYRAIYLNHTGDEDYVLQLSVPPTIKDKHQQEAVKFSLSWAMKDHISRFSGKQLAYENIRVEISNSSADDQPDSSCEFNHIPHSTESPPGPYGFSVLPQDQLVVGESHDMNDGKNVLNEGGMHSANSHPENECIRKTSKRKHGSNENTIPLEDILNYDGRLVDAAYEFEVSESRLKAICREYGIRDWRHRQHQHMIKNNQNLSKPKVRIEYVHDEGAEVGNQMTGGSRSCEKELNHEENGLLPESEKGSDRSLMEAGLMKDSSTKLQIDHNISATVATNTNQVPESSQANLSCFDLAPKIVAANVAPMTPPVTEMQDTNTVTMKVTYGEVIKRFQFSLTFGISELTKVVAAKLKLEVNTFKIMYLDDEDEWISMDDDGDLKECLKISVSPGFKNIRLKILR